MPSSHGNDVLLTDYVKTLIQVKARQLRRQRGFTRSDEDDLRQELWLALIGQADKFDPRRASFNTFVDRVVRTAVRMLLRRSDRLERDLLRPRGQLRRKDRSRNPRVEIPVGEHRSELRL